MSPDVFLWDVSSNTRSLVWGRASVIQNDIVALRSAEALNPEVGRQTVVAPVPAGPTRRLGAGSAHCYVIWPFAPNADLAKRFLVDLVGASQMALTASQLCNLPAFPGAVPGLIDRLRGAPAPGSAPTRADLATVLAGAAEWSASVGYPGYATPAIDETSSRSIVPRMFARVARRTESAEASARRAEEEMRQIFERHARR
jgi:hypothetical protein